VIKEKAPEQMISFSINLLNSEYKIDPEKVKEAIDINLITDIREFKLHNNTVEFYLFRITKYSENQLFVFEYQYKEGIEPECFDCNLYSLEDLIEVCKIFILYKARDKLYKVFKYFFKDNNIKMFKDIGNPNYIKLFVSITMTDEDKSNLPFHLIEEEGKVMKFFMTIMSIMKNSMKGIKKKTPKKC
jgi:hypothetical protein